MGAKVPREQGPSPTPTPSDVSIVEDTEWVSEMGAVWQRSVFCPGQDSNHDTVVQPVIDTLLCRLHHAIRVSRCS